MFRLGSDLLPFYVKYNSFYKKRESLIENKLKYFGDESKKNNLRAKYIIITRNSKLLSRNST